MAEFVLNRDQYVELEKLSIGAFSPLAGFMNQDTFRTVVDNMTLPDGQVFPLPVVLDVPELEATKFRDAHRVTLVFAGSEVGFIQPESVYSWDKHETAQKLYGTIDDAHPGVRRISLLGDILVGGPVVLERRHRLPLSEEEPIPEETRKLFADKGWKTIAGFATRNVPHRAHEYLHRQALEITDGLFIQPTIGSPRTGDFTPQAIMAGYQPLMGAVYPPGRTAFGFLSTVVRYAGPREAILQAIVRRNYGCTHFIIGRDHSGVGDYYEKYAAHDLARKLEDKLGIEILYMLGPYYCSECRDIVTEEHCPHAEITDTAVNHINATDIRKSLADGIPLDTKVIRSEILDSLKGIEILFEGEE